MHDAKEYRDISQTESIERKLRESIEIERKVENLGDKQLWILLNININKDK